MSRPFGVALLLAGYDDKGPQLFFSDPSGTFTQFKAKAIGAYFLSLCGLCVCVGSCINFMRFKAKAIGAASLFVSLWGLVSGGL